MSYLNKSFVNISKLSEEDNAIESSLTNINQLSLLTIRE